MISVWFTHGRLYAIADAHCSRIGGIYIPIHPNSILNINVAVRSESVCVVHLFNWKHARHVVTASTLNSSCVLCSCMCNGSCSLSTCMFSLILLGGECMLPQKILIFKCFHNSVSAAYYLVHRPHSNLLRAETALEFRLYARATLKMQLGLLRWSERKKTEFS